MTHPGWGITNLPVFNKEQTHWLRAAKEGIHLIRNLWRGLDGNVEVVTLKRLTEWLEPRLHYMCLQFQQFGVTGSQAGLAGSLHCRQGESALRSKRADRNWGGPERMGM
jgi:hypothetical protein